MFSLGYSYELFQGQKAFGWSCSMSVTYIDVTKGQWWLIVCTFAIRDKLLCNQRFSDISEWKSFLDDPQISNLCQNKEHQIFKDEFSMYRIAIRYILSLHDFNTKNCLLYFVKLFFMKEEHI